MKKKTLAKFGVFEIDENGNDELRTARNTKGKPFQTRAEAQYYIREHIDNFQEFKGRNFTTRGI